MKPSPELKKGGIVKLKRSRVKTIVTILAVLGVGIASSSCSILQFFRDTVPEGINQLVEGPSTQTPPNHTINLAGDVALAWATIESSGGAISVDKPGDPLDGLKIDVPAGSYPDTKGFSVSYAPITGHDFGDNFNPATPLISVDNGGGYSDEMMLVTIPTEIPEGKFAMGFFYDKEAGTLEGIPIVEEDATHITIATRHFSNIVVSLIDNAVLSADIDSHFRPGVDDWQFTNYSSYISPSGHCWGQSLTAMWYYCEKTLNGAPHLYGLYDNNGGPKTPKLWEDDSLGYRLASTVQEDQKTDELLWAIGAYMSWADDWLEYRAFAYAILLTGEPQYVQIRTSDLQNIHAMVVYRVMNNTLYIADPNYPGRVDRKIELVGGGFKPYNSGDNADAIQRGEGKEYPWIFYFAKTTFIDWEKIGKHWGEFEAKTVGNDKFPKYTIKVLNDIDEEIELQDSYKTKKKGLAITDVSTVGGDPCDWFVYRNGEELDENDDGEYDLKPGANQLGIAVWGDVNGKSKWIDFKYISVVSEAEEVTPPKPAIPNFDNLLIAELPSYSNDTNTWDSEYGRFQLQLCISMKDGTITYSPEVCWNRDEHYSQVVSGNYDKDGNATFTFEYANTYSDSGTIVKGTFVGKIKMWQSTPPSPDDPYSNWEVRGTVEGSERVYFTPNSTQDPNVFPPYDSTTDFRVDMATSGR
jgi:hypothetical protein